MVKTPPSNTGMQVRFPLREPKIPHAEGRGQTLKIGFAVDVSLMEDVWSFATVCFYCCYSFSMEYSCFTMLLASANKVNQLYV